MSIPNTGNREVQPIHPGEMLREDFLPDYKLTISGLADALGVSRQTVNELVRERRAVSPEMALRRSGSRAYSATLPSSGSTRSARWIDGMLLRPSGPTSSASSP